MLFSIIVPVYNVEKYLRDCLVSIEKQTFRDFEIIIIDDGSIDSSGRIADDFASENQNARVLHGENQGLLMARRKGLKYCRGEYIVFLDADDSLREDALEKLNGNIKATAADIISFRLSDKSDFSSAYDAEFLPSGYYGGSGYIEYQKKILLGLSNNLCGKAIRFRCFDVSDSYECFSGLMYGEDLLQSLPVTDAASSISRIEDILYFYRQNEESSTACFKDSYIWDIERVALRVLYYGGRWDMADDAIRGASRLYVSLIKMLTDSIDAIGADTSKDQLVKISHSMNSLGLDTPRMLKLMRLDQRCILKLAFSSRMMGLKAFTKASHLGRKVLGRSL